MFFSTSAATKSPTGLVKTESSLLGLDFEAFTLSERDDVGLSATQSPYNPSSASHVSDSDVNLYQSPKETSAPQMGSNLYVASLPETCTDAQLHQLFAPFGPIISAKVMCRKGSNVCKGYGFVLFRHEEDAAVAQASMIGRVVEGNKIQVRRAHTAASAPLLSVSTTSPHAQASSERTGPARHGGAPPPSDRSTIVQQPGPAPLPSYSGSLPHWDSWLANTVVPPAYPQDNTAFLTAPQAPTEVQWSPHFPPAQGHPSVWGPVAMGMVPAQPGTQVVYVMLPP